MINVPNADRLLAARFRPGASAKAHAAIGWNWKPKPLRDYDLWYVLSGRGTMYLGDSVYPLRKGCCLLLRPGDRPNAMQEIDDRLTHIYIHFQIEEDTATPSSRLADNFLPPTYTQIEDVFEFEELLHRILEILERRESFATEEFDCMIKQVFLRIYRTHYGKTKLVSLKQSRAVSKAINLILGESRQRIAHDQIAKQIGLTPKYLSLLFKRCTGLPLKEYITHARMERAMFLLTETTMNVTEVAETLGYTSIFLFSKQFKDKYGQPPSQFSMKKVTSRAHLTKFSDT